MSKYSKGLKLIAIHHYLAGKEGFMQAALQHGLRRVYCADGFCLSAAWPEWLIALTGGNRQSYAQSLSREFSVGQANQKLATDVTEFNVNGRKVYLSPVIDPYNQEIVSHVIADRPQMSMVMQVLGKALKRLHPNDKPVLHSDQGWQHQMQAHQETLEGQGIIQSMSRKGGCLDDTIMEGWFGTMKTGSPWQEL